MLLGALPYIVVGLRTAVSISFYTLVAAELAGAFAGIVYRIEIAQQNLQTGQVMGGLAALGSMSFVADRDFRGGRGTHGVVAMMQMYSGPRRIDACASTAAAGERAPSPHHISVADLSIVFDTPQGQVIAVDRVTFSVGSGEFVCIVGPSGCGKSTVLNTIAGLETPYSGAVMVDGRPMQRPRPDRRHGVPAAASVSLEIRPQEYRAWPAHAGKVAERGPRDCRRPDRDDRAQSFRRRLSAHAVRAACSSALRLHGRWPTSRACC